jgi:hypothetical protein
VWVLLIGVKVRKLKHALPRFVLALEELADAASGLPDALLVLYEREADGAFAAEESERTVAVKISYLVQ